MKRIVLTVVSSSMLVLAAPGIAAAAHHHARHNARHASAHTRHAHAKHASVITLGTLAAPTAATTTTPPPTPKSPTPAVTPVCSPEQIGTVVSFENENLTIELCDKSTYTGEVTEGTEILCRAEETSEEGKVHHDEDSYLTKGEGDEEDDCSTTLVKGAKIYGAELNFTSYGPIWEKVGLLE